MRKNISVRILELMGEDAYKNLTHKELNTIFASSKNDEKEIANILDLLIESGDVIKTKKNKFGLALKNGYVTGNIRINPKGFGFIINEPEDLYVSGSNMNSAMDGDLVMARIVGEGTDTTSTEAEIVKILKRNTDKIVGEYSDNKDFGFVIPIDSKQSYDVFIARKNKGDARNKDIVVCKITRYPNNGKKPEGKIIEILGKKNNLDVEIESEVVQKGVKSEFDKKTINYVNDIEEKISTKEIKRRYDLREKLTFTIDGDDAKDLDDAISIEKKDNGNYVLGVHIADVSHYIKENSPADKEALLRGTSIYFANRVIPMLPKKISNNLCSLNPNQDKLTLSCIMEYNKSGKIIDYRIEESIIKSDFRLTYNQVSDFIENVENNGIAALDSPELEDALLYSNELSKILEACKNKRGNIDFDFPEAKYIIEDNKVTGIQKRETRVANKIIEEFMIAANELIAETYFVQEIPFLYRVHEEPNPEKLSNILTYLKNINIETGIKKDNAIRPGDIQGVLRKAKELEQYTIISYALLRSLKKAKYSSENLGHFGLASKYYTHFTSPIRRYPDLQIHRIIKENLSGKLDEKRIAHYESIISDVAKQTSDKEIEAMEVERSVGDLLRCHYMKDKIGEEFDGMIISVTNFGMFVMFENTIEGLVRFADVKNDFFVFDQENFCARGERTGKIYTVGDKVRTRIDSIDFSFKEIRLTLI